MAVEREVYMRLLVSRCLALILSVGPGAAAADRANSIAQVDANRDVTVKVVGRFIGGEGRLDDTRVLIADDFVVIGDWLEKGPPDEFEETPSLGAVYVLPKGVAFTEENAQKLVAPEGTEMRCFGLAMATNGHRIAVAGQGRAGAYSSTLGLVKGRPNMVYVFGVGATGRWELESRLVPNAAEGALDDSEGGGPTFENDNLYGVDEKHRPTPAGMDDNAGNSLAFIGDTLFVGSFQPGGNPFASGVVYVFRLMQDSTWKQVWTIKSPDPKSGKEAAKKMFGWSLAADRSLLLVGQPGYGNSGAAFLFERGEGDAWRLKDKLVLPGRWLNCGFGSSVALDSGSALIGSAASRCPALIYDLRGERTKVAATVAPAPPSRTWIGERVALEDGRAAISMSNGVLLYRRLAGGWKEVAVVSPPDGAHSFPLSLALHGGTLAVGAAKGADAEKEPNSVFFYALPAEWTRKQ